MKISTRMLTAMAMLGALSIVLVAVIHFPLLPSAAFLEYDPADIPILISTFAFGPVAGLLLTIVVSVVQGLTVSAQSGIYGIIMHVIATGTYVLVAGFIYKHKKTRKNAAVSIACGTVAMTIIMAGANLVVTPVFMGAPVSAIIDMMPGILLFNLAKAGINGVVTFLLYKPISHLIHGDYKHKTVEGAKAEAVDN